MGVNEGDDIIGEVGCLERDRGKARCLPKPLYECGPVAEPLDPRYRPIPPP